MTAFNPISGVASAIASSAGTAAGINSTPKSTGAAPFSDLLTDSIGEVNSLQDQAATAVKGLMTGSGVDVHQAMIATEKASMAFEMALAVRNKAVQAYQQVMSMQF
jgi:flagellar hook-basal body complex protein FliE